MLWTITILLVVLWAIGMVSGATLGWWIHLLLILAVISLIFAVMRRGSAAV
ncbi:MULTISPECIES: lmo0937 family membrane protein [Anaeromyxobacter]|uniref:lmo0937 family membrane protein n=1 Tax=Anaeromyxobacter TaxID=161492 RepID=UPI001F56246F|nr:MULTISPECIES: lmo0937 family membrane protein [unclassified Anaeromyxobacter]